MAKKTRNKLTVKQQKFVAEAVKTGNNTQAYKTAYKPKTSNKHSLHRQAHEVSRKPQVQAAIDAALKLHGLTPEYAIGELAYIVGQNKEIGAKRLAIRDTLELHGWRKEERPQTTLQIHNAFFNETRLKEPIEQNNDDVIDIEDSDSTPTK